MADSKKINKDEIQALEIGKSIADDLMKEDEELVEYIQPSSLELLKARYAAAEEDEQIRNEGFEPLKKSGLIKKQRPESTVFGYYASPINPKDEIRTDVNSPLSEVFDATKTEYDADTVSFGDIELSDNTTSEIANTSEKPQSENKPSAVDGTNRYGFDTHTRVIYLDESTDDGIKKNTDEELSAAFKPDDNGKKRRKLPWSTKKT